MAVDDHKAVVAAIPQELLANPDQVFRILLLERHARPNAGVDEQIVAKADVELEGFDEVAVRLRHLFGELPRQAPVVVSAEQGATDRHPVGTQGRVAAVHEEGRAELRRLRHKTGQQGVVIAAQAQRPAIRGGELYQAVDDGRRIGAAVGVVADVDDAMVGDRPGGQVGGDLAVDLGQHGVAAMDIADGVEAHAVGGA